MLRRLAGRGAWYGMGRDTSLLPQMWGTQRDKLVLALRTVPVRKLHQSDERNRRRGRVNSGREAAMEHTTYSELKTERLILAIKRINELEQQLAQAEFQRDAALEGWRIVGEQLAALTAESGGA